jgi:hypothetical protein
VFAKGNEITASSGQRVKLSRPLDFLVVADHSDGMGFFPMLLSGSQDILNDPQGKKWYEMIQSGKGADAALDIVTTFGKGQMPKAIFPLPGTAPYRSAWAETIKAAEEANDPGRFTAFIGFEWTSNTGGNNLHRNVIFRDNAAKASLVEPYTTIKPLGSDNPRDLWRWMQTYEEKTNGSVLAIAHNGNLSNGRMFPRIESFTGKPIDREYAEQRAQWERLYEATRSPAVVGYQKGVPMGGDLHKGPAGTAPTFLVAALKDPIGANLDRIQIIKGWLDAKGETHEKVYDLAWSGDRKPDPKTGKLPAVGNTVDVPNATWTNTIGTPELIKVWKDPDFDATQSAFYYVRVLEIPTPRWTAFDAKYFGIKLPPEVTMTVQERAYTSPIWYTPAK